MSLERIDFSSVPQHLACVMDGNGRWAATRGLPRSKGHEAGLEALFEAVEGSLALGLGWLTVFAFSTENWRRPDEEVRFLLDFNKDILRRRRNELHEMGVRLRFIGRRDRRLSGTLLREMDSAAELTAENQRLKLTVAFNYGSRTEMTDAVRAIIAQGYKPAQVDEEVIASHLYTSGIPDVDLLVRTSGEHRVSNFLLWQLAYAELVFLDVLWPDFTREHLFEAVAEYQVRKRRFGGLEQ